MEIERLEVAKLIGDPANARKHNERNIDAIVASLARFGQQKPIVIDKANVVRAGNGTLQAARSLGWTHVDCVRSKLDGADASAYAIADNRTAELAEWDDDVLAATLEGLQLEGMLDVTGFDDDELAELLGGLSEDQKTSDQENHKATATLAERFMAVPFTVLNAREGWWQDRKRAWLSLGIKSEEGRSAAVGGSKMVSGYSEDGERKTGLVAESDTSIFDPVLCELCYRWWSPPGGVIIDPFAGGSVRGIVANKTGRVYVGQELRPEQVAANREQAKALCLDGVEPRWIEGDSRTIDATCSGVQADMLFTCPPYADLEVYSDHPSDISTLPYKQFREAYFEIVKKACCQLKKDRFAVVVVGEVRDKQGNYYNFVGDTVQAMREAGLHYYNEAILVTAVGSLPIRAGKQFSASRKLGKTHQNVLVFAKGDGKLAAAACGSVEVADPAEMFGEITAQ